ncbi:hypothetical protein [Actinomadura sp. CNU-125]|uniref:hypothetical protein n=1 Tax=Actinomadura sp. CNU-125 TaxID=1904961 RepID=UPI001300D5DB|nr:hypothetical protein [Actinomadura sp. CNU-125]
MNDHDRRGGTGIREIDAPGLPPGPGHSRAVSSDLPGRLVVEIEATAVVPPGPA